MMCDLTTKDEPGGKVQLGKYVLGTEAARSGVTVERRPKRIKVLRGTEEPGEMRDGRQREVGLLTPWKEPSR